MRRAVHQVLDDPQVFHDPLAVPIAGELEHTSNAEHPFSRALRAFIAVRSRYAEEQLALAVARGVKQYVVLGAGLDTFAYRNPFEAAGLHVFEVDHPSTQEWKRGRLRDAGIRIPDTMTFAAVDFERQSLADQLIAAGFRPDAGAFFSWLGVTLIFHGLHSIPRFNSSRPCPRAAAWSSIMPCFACSSVCRSAPLSMNLPRAWLVPASRFSFSSIQPRSITIFGARDSQR
jgi:hypothetical protein